MDKAIINKMIQPLPLHANNNRHHSEMKDTNDRIYRMNNHIYDMLAKLTDTISKID